MGRIGVQMVNNATISNKNFIESKEIIFVCILPIFPILIF